MKRREFVKAVAVVALLPEVQGSEALESRNEPQERHLNLDSFVINARRCGWKLRPESPAIPLDLHGRNAVYIGTKRARSGVCRNLFVTRNPAPDGEAIVDQIHFRDT
jgi:hypothetical protein